MQTEEIVDENGVTPPGSVCYLTVPAAKTSREFTKPVAPIVYNAIHDWMAIRPVQPDIVDEKTGVHVPFLLMNRGRLVSAGFFNGTVIPTLCAKAGVPRSDSRGKITSHRARSSTLTALANATHPLSLLELMKWAGHSEPRSTLHYLGIRPTRFAATFAQADNTAHMIEVLIDHESVMNGDAAKGRPYKFYDLGDSYCSNPFWSTCPHRMACARCDFNLPKESAAGHALEARASVDRLLEEVPLTDDERAMAEGDREAIEGLIEKLTATPTPDGRTPPEILFKKKGTHRAADRATALYHRTAVMRGVAAVCCIGLTSSTTANALSIKGGERSFAADAKVLRLALGSGNSVRNLGRYTPGRHEGREADLRRGREGTSAAPRKRTFR
ncbi:hypothetical protein [Palleronia sp. LCG004]|uniref:hypothetical protein n=1 Tax=Palleronia sp. LCG004 TaxID=3079304 RepID=UPI00397D6E8D